MVTPPPPEVEAVEGYGSASVSGAQAAVKGKFAFLFRRPGLGRIEALDPLGRTVYVMLFLETRAYFILPSRRAYAEEPPAEMMDRFLGFSLSPGEVLHLLSGRWPRGGPAGGPDWTIRTGPDGRVLGGDREGLVFRVIKFFGRTGVPREVGFSRPGTTGRLKVLSLRFNPPERGEPFDTHFLDRFTRRPWDDIAAEIEREN